MEISLERLYPTPALRVPLFGLYLGHDLRAKGSRERPYLYSNFIASLDGRISQFDPRAGRPIPPRSTRHPDDWRLYLELAAQADAVVTSGRRMRELGNRTPPAFECVPDLARGDLTEWRIAKGLPPHPACIVLSTALDIPIAALREHTHGDIVVLTGAQATEENINALRETGITVVRAPGQRVEGGDLYRVIREREYSTVYSIGGPDVFATFIATGQLHRLYLTIALRLIAGEQFDTLLRNALPVETFALHELHFDPPREQLPALLLASLDRSSQP